MHALKVQALKAHALYAYAFALYSIQNLFGHPVSNSLW